jgi:endogenous inhibitor of DNA gyrase (YacG/DUF329 family)
MKRCIVCLTEFTPKNSKGNFCTKKCKQVDYRRRIAKLLMSVKENTVLSSAIEPMAEVKGKVNVEKGERIAALELELSNLGNGTYANSYKKVLEKKIYDLKYL